MTRKNTEEDRSRDTETGEAAAEELATDEHGKTRKQQKQQKQQQKNLPRTNTEKHGKEAAEAETRKKENK